MKKKSLGNAVKRSPVVAKSVRHTILSAALLAGAVLGTDASAIGFGQIEGDSALGEPLNLRIPVQIRPEENIEVSSLLADIPDYWEHSKRGVEPVGVQDIKPEVVVTPGGRTEIKLTSQDPVREPVINFLLRLKWPNGEMLKEYSLIIDLPGANVPGVTVSRSRPVIRRPSARQPAKSLYSGLAAVTREEGNGARRFGPVQPGETLSGVVSQFYPGLGARGAAAGLVLVKINPQAFINGDPNRLIAGATLVLPPRTSMFSAVPVEPSATSSKPLAATAKWHSYVVQPGDTLGRIANVAVDGHAARTIHLMDAIVDGNPQAFVGGDRNRMLNGITLRIPADGGAVAPVPQLSASTRAPSTEGSSWQHYTVRSGDVLSRIALAVADGDATGIVGLMDVIVAANPRAFVDGDRNRMRSGITLRIPAGEAEVAPTAQRHLTASGLQLSLSTEAPTAQQSTRPTSEKVVERDSLRLKLDHTLTSIDTEKIKQTTLSAQIEDAEEKIEVLQARTLAQDDTIAEVQETIAQVEAAIEQVVAPKALAPAPSTTPETIVASTGTTSTDATPTSTIPKAERTEAKSKKRVRLRAPSLLPELSFDPFSPVSLGAGTLLVVLLAGGYVLSRRRKGTAASDHRDHRPAADAARARLAELRELYAKDSSAFADPDISADNVVSINRAMAGRFAEEAVMAYSANEFEEAENLVQKAIKVDSTRVEYKELLACIYDVTNRELDANVIRSQLASQSG